MDDNFEMGEEVEAYSFRKGGLNEVSLDNVLQRGKKYSEFDLAWNEFVNFNDDSSPVWTVHLRRLFLSNNKIEIFNVPDMILYNLEILNLAYNQLRRLPEGLFYHVPNLRNMHLEGNFIDHLPESISCCAELQVLSLGDELAGNCLTRLPNGIDKLQKLELFYCSRNRLEEFPLQLLQCRNLYSIKLSANRIVALVDKVQLLNLKKLEQVDLSGNKLVKLDSKIYPPPSLKVLNLSDNEISMISQDFLRAIPKTTILLLSGNSTNIVTPSSANFPKDGKSTKPSLFELAARARINDSKVPSETSCRLTLPIKSYLSYPTKLCASCPLRFFQETGGSNAIVGGLVGFPDICCTVEVCSSKCLQLISTKRTEQGYLQLDDCMLKVDHC